MSYGYKSDIWSLGCSMFEIAGHQPPFRAPETDHREHAKKESRTWTNKLLRHQHLQQFLLQCRNPSTVFLPVRSPNSTKEKTGKPSPSKSSSGRRVFSLDQNVSAQQPRNSPNTSSTQQLEAKLVTKRVDRTSYSAKISEDTSEESLIGDTSETSEFLFLEKEISKVPNPSEQEETSMHDEKSDKTKDLEVLNCTRGNKMKKVNYQLHSR